MTQKETTSRRTMYIVDKLIFLFYTLFVVLPYILIVPLPFTISEDTRIYYNEILNVPDGGVVVANQGMSFGNFYESAPADIVAYRMVFRACRDRGVKFILASSHPEGLSIANEILKEHCQDIIKDLTYGEDWVFLGFVAGKETMYALMARDIQKLTSRDYYGNSVKDMPIMQGINDIRDYSLMMVCIDTSGEAIVRQWWGYADDLGIKITILKNSQASSIPLDRPFVEKGQITSNLNGLRGSAELEFLAREPGLGISALSSYSLGTLYCVGLIIIATAWYYVIRMREK